MGGGISAPRARLAELVGALSLGVDLGFGQPMEDVLRRCLIALRLAGHGGLGEQDRMAVYYTALLVNVACAVPKLTHWPELVFSAVRLLSGTR